ncbi:MAG TPA: hypothetical protein VEP91_04960 [Solirubrobacterales bacterium]|nr:hypothetical protein [Solirubrobacterales bacterium]
MGTELVFSDGHQVRVSGTNAEGLIQGLNRALKEEGIRSPSTGTPLAPGWFPAQTESGGVILVNPSQVAYVRDVPDQKPILDEAL